MSAVGGEAHDDSQHRAGEPISPRSYDRGCRCPKCREVYNSYRAERAELRRIGRLAEAMRARPGEWLLVSTDVTLLPVPTAEDCTQSYDVRSQGRDIYARYVGAA